MNIVVNNLVFGNEGSTGLTVVGGAEGLEEPHALEADFSGDGAVEAFSSKGRKRIGRIEKSGLC